MQHGNYRIKIIYTSTGRQWEIQKREIIVVNGVEYVTWKVINKFPNERFAREIMLKLCITEG
jgi:hypothetical protein